MRSFWDICIHNLIMFLSYNHLDPIAHGQPILNLVVFDPWSHQKKKSWPSLAIFVIWQIYNINFVSKLIFFLCVSSMGKGCFGIQNYRILNKFMILILYRVALIWSYFLIDAVCENFLLGFTLIKSLTIWSKFLLSSDELWNISSIYFPIPQLTISRYFVKCLYFLPCL